MKRNDGSVGVPNNMFLFSDNSIVVPPDPMPNSEVKRNCADGSMMMNWQASMSWQTAQKRAQVYSMIRTFFNDRNVVEVETPLMSQGTISDLHLDAFSTKYNFLSSGVDKLYIYKHHQSLP